MAASAANARPRLGCGFLRTISFPRRRISTWLTGKRNSFDKSTARWATRLAQLSLLLRRFPRSSLFGPRLLGCGFLHRSEEHTSELQSLRHLVRRLLLEK